MAGSTQELAVDQAMTLCNRASALVVPGATAHDILDNEDGVKSLGIAVELIRTGIDSDEIVRRMAKILQAFVAIRLASNPFVPESRWSSSLDQNLLLATDQPIRLGNSNIYSNDFTTPSLFRKMAGRWVHENATLNVVARVVRNAARVPIAESASRFVEIDIGDGRHTKMRILRDSELFYEYGNHSFFANGSVVILRKIEAAVAPSGLYLVFHKNSSAKRLQGATWKDTIDWIKALEAKM